MTEICVINLDRSKDRWNHISKQFEKADLEITRISGVDGKLANHPLFEKYCDELSIRWKGRSLSAGQLGCFASHYLTWERCVNSKSPIIVIEDDAVISDKLKVFIDNLTTLPKQVECVRLFRNHSKHFRTWPVKTIADGIELVKYTKGPMRATAYYITPPAAKKFIEASQRWFLPVDITMDRFWDNGVECYGVLPEIVWNDESLDSTIGYDEPKVARPLRVRARRELFNLQEQLLKWISNIRFLLRRPR
ncbi:glycosyltransferase family 25 protein [Marinobacter alkaliphilus]|uniref:Glycosyltransferase family 25 protein n=1 Tax=Marinobacter alkaliphilus TaxID=254719 RepID=A0ABZ3E5Z6_9GAMM